MKKDGAKRSKEIKVAPTRATRTKLPRDVGIVIYFVPVRTVPKLLLEELLSGTVSPPPDVCESGAFELWP